MAIRSYAIGSGETNRVEDKVQSKISYQPFDKLRTGFQPSAISWKLYELRVICRKLKLSFGLPPYGRVPSFTIRNSQFEIISRCPMSVEPV